MGKIATLLIAALIFGVIYFLLIPLILVEAITSPLKIIVVLAAIIYLFGELGNYNWPWNKK